MLRPVSQTRFFLHESIKERPAIRFSRTLSHSRNIYIYGYIYIYIRTRNMCVYVMQNLTTTINYLSRQFLITIIYILFLSPLSNRKTHGYTFFQRIIDLAFRCVKKTFLRSYTREKKNEGQLTKRACSTSFQVLSCLLIVEKSLSMRSVGVRAFSIDKDKNTGCFLFGIIFIDSAYYTPRNFGVVRCRLERNYVDHEIPLNSRFEFHDELDRSQRFRETGPLRVLK